MGIDKPDVRYVLHFHPPRSIDSFYQESGRAGRDGKPSVSVMYYSLEDFQSMSWVISNSGSTEDEYKRISLSKLQDVNSLCTETVCRRKYLLQCFGESYTVPSPRDPHCCDLCDPAKHKRDLEFLQKNVFSKTRAAAPQMGFVKVSKMVNPSTVEDIDDDDEDDMVAAKPEKKKPKSDPMPGFMKPTTSGSFTEIKPAAVQKKKEAPANLSGFQQKCLRLAKSTKNVIDAENVTKYADLSPVERENQVKRFFEKTKKNGDEKTAWELASEMEYQAFQQCSKRYDYNQLCSKTLASLD